MFVETCRAFFCPGLVQLWWAICSDNAIYLIPIISTLTITINVDIAKGTKTRKRAMLYILFRYSITVKTTSPSLCFVFVYIIHIWPHTAGVAKNAKVCFVYLCIYVSYSSLCISPPQVCTLGEASVYVYIIFHSKVFLSIGSPSSSSLGSHFRIQAKDLFYKWQIYSQPHIFRHVLTQCLVLSLSSSSLSSWFR